jgi:hypothetical protein
MTILGRLPSGQVAATKGDDKNEKEIQPFQA